MIILINDHSCDDPGTYGTIINARNAAHAGPIVEKWQREHWRARITGRPQACTWKVAESDNIVDALAESAKAKGETNE